MTTLNEQDQGASGDAKNPQEPHDLQPPDEASASDQKKVRKESKQSHGVKAARGYQAMASSYAVRQK